MTKKPKSPKGHHYVPRSYLNRFTDTNGFLYVNDFKRNQRRRQRPKEVMKIDSYYRQNWAPTGIDVNIFETELAKGVENDAKNIFDKLVDSPHELSERDIENLVLYIELQRIRVPRQAETAMDLMRSVILKSAPPDITREIHNGQLQLTMKDPARFDYMRMAIGTIHPWISRMNWEIIEADSESVFITTDSPVSFYNSAVLPPAEPGLALAGTIIFFPLNSKKLLLIRHHELKTEDSLALLKKSEIDKRISLTYGRVWDKTLVERTNRKLATLARELIVGENESVWETTRLI
ncbi:MAG: DUF4238 domain-containing protein [Nitrosomonas sp. PRO4]|nr:DUF4238 domain-containing protein [Nitrosomonas sp. PRO4]